MTKGPEGRFDVKRIMVVDGHERIRDLLAELLGAEVATQTVLEFEGRTLGKPVDAGDAAARWREMRGRSATLFTGHWVIDDREDGTSATFGAVSGTEVHFADISDAEIEAYVATGEPLAVAGAFTIDGLAGPYVERIEGDPHTVVGIGLPLLREMLAEIGVEWHTLWNRPRG